jgi:long-chain fatty acid transport protein
VKTSIPELARQGLLAAVGLAVAAAAPATNGYFAESFGTKSNGVAGASTAFVQDALTIATNPAGLTQLQDGFDVGVDVFIPRRGATFDQGGTQTSFNANDTGTFLIPALGYNHRLGERLAWGLALFGNGGLNTDYATNPYSGFGAQGAAGVNLSQAFLSPALAWRFAHGQSLGIAVNFAYQQFEAKGLGLFAGFSSDPANLSNRGKDSATGVGWRLGWLGELAPGFTVGASWQPKTSVGRFDKYAGLFADHGRFDIPETYALGVAVDAGTHLTFSLDWQRIQYAGVPAVGNSIASLFAGVPLGATDGPGFGWRNVSVVKVGARFRANDALTLRAGFSSGSQPVPASQTFFNVLAPGVVQQHLTLGASYRVGTHSTIDFSLLHAFEHTVNGSGSIPPAFGGGEVNVRLKEDSLGIGYSQRL